MPLILSTPPPQGRPARRASAAWLGRVLLACWGLLAVLNAAAQDADRAAPRDATQTAAKPPPVSRWEGAIGLSLQSQPEYAGASRREFKLEPVFFLRYGRFSLSNGGGFATRRSDDALRGLGVDMVQSDRLRVHLSARFDGGRKEDTSAEFAGLGDIRPTVRARLSASLRLTGPWRAGATWSFDALGRGGGNHGDISVGWERRLTPATQLNLGLGLSLAGDRYMQTYFGISPEQAARSGRPQYEPSAGFRDIAASASLRHELDRDWTVLVGLTASRLLGPAADSPLSRKPGAWSASAAAAWRF